MRDERGDRDLKKKRKKNGNKIPVESEPDSE
jgi:hypothetical protein